MLDYDIWLDFLEDQDKYVLDARLLSECDALYFICFYYHAFTRDKSEGFGRYSGNDGFGGQGWWANCGFSDADPYHCELFSILN